MARTPYAMKLFSTITACLCVGFALGQGHGDPNNTNGLRFLAPLIGTWVGKTTFNTQNGKPLEGDTTCKFTVVIRGHYVKQDQTTFIPEAGTFDTTNFFSYDKRMGFYNAWWFFDSANNEPTRVQGKMEGKKLVLLTIEPPPTTKPTLRRTLNFEVPNVLDDTMEIQQNGTWRTLFKIHYTKKTS